MKTRKNVKGFTLVELIVVIAIIGVASYTFVLINPALAVIAYVIVCISMVVSIVSYFLYLSHIALQTRSWNPRPSVVRMIPWLMIQKASRWPLGAVQ